MSIAGGCAAVVRMLDVGRQCTAMLCFSDVLATGALYELQRQGIDVPRDLSLIGIEDLPSSVHTSPRLTTVHLPVREMGTGTASALAEWIEHDRRPESALLPAQLIVRESTASPA